MSEDENILRLVQAQDAMSSTAVLQAQIQSLMSRVEDLEDDFPEDIGGGGEEVASVPVEYAFAITATQEFDGNGEPYDPPRYTVNVRGGTAQALGQSPADFNDAEFTGVTATRYFYIAYDMTAYEWVGGIMSDTSIPEVGDSYPIVIGAIDEAGVRQDRLGAIECIVKDNSVDVP